MKGEGVAAMKKFLKSNLKYGSTGQRDHQLKVVMREFYNEKRRRHSCTSVDLPLFVIIIVVESYED